MRLNLIAALLCCAALAGCATPSAPVETRWKTVTVTKRAACPDKATYARLKAARPAPLRTQTRPRSGAERVGKVAAQLGLYEAEGKWADQVSAALDRCQVADTSEGVADGP